jgi:hypothetical protein
MVSMCQVESDLISGYFLPSTNSSKKKILIYGLTRETRLNHINRSLSKCHVGGAIAPCSFISIALTVPAPQIKWHFN